MIKTTLLITNSYHNACFKLSNIPHALTFKDESIYVNHFYQSSGCENDLSTTTILSSGAKQNLKVHAVDEKKWILQDNSLLLKMKIFLNWKKELVMPYLDHYKKQLAVTSVCTTEKTFDDVLKHDRNLNLSKGLKSTSTAQENKHKKTQDCQQ